MANMTLLMPGFILAVQFAKFDGAIVSMTQLMPEVNMALQFGKCD